MNTATSAVTVLGAGSYGTALAICLARNGHNVTLWGRNSQDVATLAAERKNQRYLPDIPFPDTLTLEADLQQATAASDIVLVVVPSHAFADTLKQIKPALRPNAKIAWATKGLEPDTGRLLQEVAVQELGEEVPLAVLSGPTFAKEMAMGSPTAISVSSTSSAFAKQIADLLHCGRSFRVYNNDDFIGIQLGGAVKNVLAIAAGISDGLGFGANARAAIITRGLAEIMRLSESLGAEHDTIMGLSGVGDLVLTCTDDQSRNRRLGLALGRGQDAESAIKEIGQAVEGAKSSHCIGKLAERAGVEMPICDAVHRVIYQGLEPKQAVKELLARQLKPEF